MCRLISIPYNLCAAPAYIYDFTATRIPAGAAGWLATATVAIAMALGPSVRAAQDTDFGVRVEGEGSFCAKSEADVDVYIDLNRTGTNSLPVRGLTIAVCHFSHQLDLLEALPGAAFDPQAGTTPDFLSLKKVSGGVIQTVVMALKGEKELIPANNLHAVHLKYLVNDASDPAPIWPCDQHLGSPPVPILFSSGKTSYFPPENNLEGIEIHSRCSPSERIFRLSTQVQEPLKVLCETGEGTTIVDVMLSEDPVSCCPAKLLKGLSLAVRMPEDLKLVRFLPGELNAVRFRSYTQGSCNQLDLIYMPSVRLDRPKTVFRMEIGATKEIWQSGRKDTARTVTFSQACAPGWPEVGVNYINGQTAHFANLTEAQAVLNVVPYCPKFIRGDVNADGRHDISDAIMLLTWLYTRNAEKPPCLDAADSNDDGKVDLADAVTILSVVAGPQTGFVTPSGSCGHDPNPDKLSCKSFQACGN